MKKIVFKEQKMSFKSNYKLKIKLYNMILRKKLKNFMFFHNMKFVLPAFVLGIFAI